MVALALGSNALKGADVKPVSADTCVNVHSNIAAVVLKRDAHKRKLILFFCRTV